MVMSEEYAEMVEQKYDLAFWRNVIRLKREIKLHEKEAVIKRRELSIAFNDVCARFVVSPSSDTEK